MTIDILICTIDDGVNGIGEVLMPSMPDVHYVVSVQYSSPEPPIITAAWASRPDVTVTMLAGRGLSRNRNNALRHATGDIIVISDDDCRYTPKSIEIIRRAYQQHPEADIICFEMADHDGNVTKHYPNAPLTYDEACRQGYYAASVEMTFSRKALKALHFNESFGLGTSLPAGEEDILLIDLQRAGLHAMFVPDVITMTDPVTTGDRFLQDARLQVTKGAVFRHCYGVAGALWRTLKEGAHHFVYNHTNPLPIWFNMLQGIWK